MKKLKTILGTLFFSVLTLIGILLLTIVIGLIGLAIISVVDFVFKFKIASLLINITGYIFVIAITVILGYCGYKTYIDTKSNNKNN